jgi:hypothetical protein
LQITEKEIKGACYSLAAFNSKLLASINSTVSQHFKSTNRRAFNQQIFSRLNSIQFSFVVIERLGEKILFSLYLYIKLNT